MKSKIIVLFALTLASYATVAQVGIGTTSPDASAALDLQSTTSGILIPRMTTAQRDAISSPASGLMIYNVSTSSFQFYNGAEWTEMAPADERWTSDATNSQIYLTYTSDGATARSGNNNFVITDAGRVGIGTDSPSGHFEVSSTGGTNVDIVAGGNGRPQMRFFNGGGYGWNFGVVNPGTATMSDGFVIRDVKKGQDRFKISSTGNFGMGIDPYSTGDRLRVNGDISASGFNTTSDARLKSNILDVTNGVDIIQALRPVEYSKLKVFEGDLSSNEFGFIAQEVREILPQVVRGEESDSTYLSINYNSFIAILTAATQEQEARIQALETALAKETLANQNAVSESTIQLPTNYAYAGGFLALIAISGMGWYAKGKSAQHKN